GVNHGAEGAVAGDLVITDAGGVGAVDQEVLGAADFAGGERAVAVGVGAVGDALAGDLDVALGVNGQLGVGGDGEFAAAAADVDAGDAVGEHEHDLGAGGDREGFVVKVHLGGAVVELAVGGGGVAAAGKRQAVGDGGEGCVGGGGGGFGGEVGGEVVGDVAVGDGAVGRAEGADEAVGADGEAGVVGGADGDVAEDVGVADAETADFDRGAADGGVVVDVGAAVGADGRVVAVDAGVAGEGDAVLGDESVDEFGPFGELDFDPAFHGGATRGGDDAAGNDEGVAGQVGVADVNLGHGGGA